MTLTQFMDALREEGVVGSEYERRVAEFIERRKAERATAIVPSVDPSMIPFPTSAQDQGIRTQRASIPVDYGDESPAEAEERWTKQEMEDPDGVFGFGGSSAGGIFGDGPIATDRYDPAARQRAAPVVAAQVQIRTLGVLKELETQLRESREENRLLREREKAQLASGANRPQLRGKK